MFFYEGQSCPVCGKRFAETDDIVTCPVCGAPHHRACWQQDGRCHFEDTHGTPQQWKNNKDTSNETAHPQNRCPHCGWDNTTYAEFCSRCGRSLPSHDWHTAQQPHRDQRPPFHEYSPFHVAYDPLGGVPHDEPFGKDTTAEDLAVSVGGNTAYYLPRFRKIRDGRSVQWNWAAFLLTPYWLLYRKQYAAGIFVCLFHLLYFTLNYTVFYMSGATDLVYLEDAFYKSYEAGFLPLLFLLAVAMVMIRVLFGLFANHLYLRTCQKRVQTAKETESFDYHSALRSKGGVSFVWGAVSYFGLSFITTLIQTIFAML